MAKQQKKKVRKAAPSEGERLIKAQAGYTCGMPGCGRRGTLLHHIDQNPANEDPSNLLLFCAECHAHVGELDAETIGMIKQSVGMRNASSEELEGMKDGILARIQLLVGTQGEPMMLNEADRGTREPDPKIETAASQALDLRKAGIVLPVGDLRALATALYASDELSSALAVVEAIKSDSVLPTDLYNMAVIQDELGRKEDSEKLYRAAAKADPGFAQAWANLGVLLRESGNFEESEKALRKAIEVDPANAPAWSSLGILLAETGQVEEAEAGFRKAIEIDPEFAPAWSNLAGILKDTDRVEEGESAYRKAIEAAPEDADLRNGFAYFLVEIGKPDEAEVQVREALRLDPDCAYAHATLGLIRLEKDDLEEGRKGYERAIELQPNDKPLRQKFHYEYGRALARAGQAWNARKELTKALKIKVEYIPTEDIEAELAKV